MILQALKDYYDRKAADPESNIAPEGWEWKEIPFIIVLDKNGVFLRFEDTREGEGNKKRGKFFLVPQGVKKTSGIAANLLWDSAAYIFAVINTDGLTNAEKEKKSVRLPEQKKAFTARIENELPDTPRRNAVLAFLSVLDISRLEKEEHWEEIYNSNPNLTFKFNDEKQLYCETEEVKNAVGGKPVANGNIGLCLVTGEKDNVAALHTSIKGVWGAQSSGANIVSFNLDAFRSFGKKQGQNAPIGEKAMFSYTTALNSLLGKDSLQRMQIGDASTVFWSERRTRFENDFSFFFSEPSKDDPNVGSEHIKQLFNAPNTGGYFEDTGTEKFFVLGLSPNAARISVRFWLRGTVAAFAGNIRRHFEDLEIVKPKNEAPYYSIWRLLVNIAVQDKSENIPPNLAGDFMRAVLDGTPYPATLLQTALRRIRSDTSGRVKPVRAALIKAYLNRRLYAAENYNKEEVLQVGLDINQPSIGYQLGRLFAVLEKIQEEANPGLNATIRERYYGAACGSPVTVYPTLMRLKNHHLAKLNPGRKINLEKLIGEIIGHFDDFPFHLDLFEQGKFAVGYYHQRQDLFTAKKDDNTANAGELF